MNSKSSRFIYFIFSAFLIIFILYHTFGSVFSTIKTEMAVKATVSDVINADGFAIRNEEIIESDKSGVMVYSVSNGGKVANDSTIIEYYNSNDDVALKKQIDSLEYKISCLEELDTQNKIYAADLDAIASQTKHTLYNMLNEIDCNNLNYIDSETDKLLYYLCQNQLATKRTSDYSGVINEYKKTLAELKSKNSSSIGSLKSDRSGYFVNTTDGYENLFDYNYATKLTVSDLSNIKPDSVSKNCVGKIISNNVWYIAAVISLDDSRSLSKGQKTNLKMSLSTTDDLAVTVESINIDYSAQKAAVIFSCANMNEELSMIRKQPIQIVVKNYSGLRVNSKAVRVVKGAKGVYVQIDKLIKFRKINIIYSTSEYVIVNSDNGTDQLRIYDDVIIKGRNIDAS